METVTLKMLLHKNSEQIGIYIAVNSSLSSRLKKIKGIKWSRTHECWYLPSAQKTIPC